MWEKYFAWHPVNCGDRTVWFEWVERRWNPDLDIRGDFSGYAFAMGGWEYRRPE